MIGRYGCVLLLLGVPGIIVAGAFSVEAYLRWHWESAASRVAIYSGARTVLQQAEADSSGKQIMLVPPNRWPQPITALHPIEVHLAREGVYIEMRQVFVDESGYFVPREGAKFKPLVGRGLSYTPLGNGVWWYHLAD
jgi:hypothetical protein